MPRIIVVLFLVLAGCATQYTTAPMPAPEIPPVVEKPKPYFDDNLIISKIKSGFSTDIELKTAAIGVESKSGEVVLKGFVGDEGQMRRAAAIAGKTPGVKRVKNNLIIK